MLKRTKKATTTTATTTMAVVAATRRTETARYGQSYSRARATGKLGSENYYSDALSFMILFAIYLYDLFAFDVCLRLRYCVHHGYFAYSLYILLRCSSIAIVIVIVRLFNSLFDSRLIIVYFCFHVDVFALLHLC